MSAPASQKNGGKNMKKIPKKNITFCILNPPRKRLNRQQQKVKELAQISHICLQKGEGEDTQSLYKCVVDEAENILATL
jgi:hypothetical protein